MTRINTVASGRTAPAATGDERYVIPNLRNACRILKVLGRHPDGLKAADLARDLRQPIYSRPMGNNPRNATLMLQVPLTEQGRFSGTVMGETPHLSLLFTSQTRHLSE